MSEDQEAGRGDFGVAAGYRFELGQPGDLNFVRRAWAFDVRDPAEVRVAVRDSVLSAPGSAVYVLRPAGGPEDTVAGFMVVSPRLRLAHWMGVKRTFRKLGLGLRLVEEAERLGVRAFARVGSWKHRVFLEGRGWTYSPRLEVIACS